MEAADWRIAEALEDPIRTKSLEAKKKTTTKDMTI